MSSIKCWDLSRKHFDRLCYPQQLDKMAFRGGTYRQGRSWSYGNRDATCDSFCKQLLLFVVSAAVIAYCLFQEYSYRLHAAALDELDLLSILQVPNKAHLEGFLKKSASQETGPAVLFSRHGEYRNRSETADDSLGMVYNGKLGPLVHFNSTDYTATVNDDDFLLKFGPKTLQLQRVTEYCQWHETSHDRCQRCTREVRRSDGRKETKSYDCHCVRQYHYLKTWSSHRVTSLFFDQPGAHHNPQRDPYPSKLFVSEDTVLTSSSESGMGLHIFPELVAHAKASTQKVRWSPRQIDSFTDFESSEAFSTHRFIYAGDGYFFSPYEGSNAEFFLKKFAQWMEGSILDYQLGDLLPSCTAGDIRVHYTVMEPEIISGIGKLVVHDTEKVEPEVAGVVSYHTSQGTHVALLRGGNFSPHELIVKEEQDLKFYLYLARGIVVAWFALWWLCRTYGFCTGQPQAASNSTKTKTL